MYAPDAPYVVYCAPCWWSDKWDPFEYGQDYDFSRPFFEQFDELMRKVPHSGLAIELSASETSPFTNYAGSLKNCYLLFHSEFDERFPRTGSTFSIRTRILDSALVLECEKLYDSMHNYKSFERRGLAAAGGGIHELRLSARLLNCQFCFASANLRNKKITYSRNRQLTKEDYEKELAKIDLGSYATYEK